MPPQLLSPAGLPALDVFGASSSSPVAEDDAPSSSRRYLDVSLPGAGPSPASGRPALKRTASTQSVNEHIMDMLNPHKQAEEIARMNGHSRKGRSSSVLSSDSDDGIGTIEDWEIEEDSPVALDSSSSKRRAIEDDDPFTVTPPASGTSMMLDSAGPSSSPTLAVQRKRRPAHPPAARAQDSDDDMDDADNNPFLNTSSDPPKASKKSMADHKKKISYVFRGKRVTYDAPLDSLFDGDDDDDESLNMVMKSGPRVLFPSPPTPAPASSSSSTIHATPRKPINLSPEARPTVSLHLMRTPRRQPHTVSGSSGTSDATLVAKSTPRVERHKASRDDGEDLEKDAPIAPFIPPTPASLPQKSQRSEEQRRLEKERLQNAMSGIQAAHQAVHNAHRGADSASAHQQRQRRYAPYPPR